MVVHMRRGDLTSLANRRTLPTSFYLQVIKQVTEVQLYCAGLAYQLQSCNNSAACIALEAQHTEVITLKHHQTLSCTHNSMPACL